ncbi:MAG: NAD-dependent epimerase/dehydratase family protein [Dysgonamonadaceae bacterium]|jgi:nucleoside-diphosphate-sugar epimerase|nr:NAD-dependent epimerase/dehydratase family protein [Dysgonamonadaceae bacterium]
MKILLIGGTGTISAAISKLLIEQGHELWLVNRGRRNDTLPEGAHCIVADVNDEDMVAELIHGMQFDCVTDFIAFTPNHLERDYRLFNGKTRQFIFISSASAYRKPSSGYRVSEDTPLANPFWQYSRDKIACEDYLVKLYRETGFPVTVVRPSHTYDERKVPTGVHGAKGSWAVVKRIIDGKPVIIQGDGTSLWTMTHNSDFARAFAGLICNTHAIGEAVQITSDETLTWNQIYQYIADSVGKQLKAAHISSDFLAAAGEKYDLRGGLLGDKAVSVVFDNSKLKRLVPGFTATKRFCEGIRETVAYILNNPEYQTEDAEFDEWCDAVIDAQNKALNKFLY